MVHCRQVQSEVLSGDRSIRSCNVLQLKEYCLVHRFAVKIAHQMVEMDEVQKDSWDPFPTAPV